MARLIGVHPSTVESWRRSGVIPAKRQSAVLSTARAENIPLEPADFFEPEKT